jgi:hypothetical protein
MAFDPKTAEFVSMAPAQEREKQNPMTILTDQVAGLEDALCEADAANEEWKAGIEDALCEIDKESEE